MLHLFCRGFSGFVVDSCVRVRVLDLLLVQKVGRVKLEKAKPEHGQKNSHGFLVVAGK